MRVDFYQLSRDPAEAVLPLIARNTLKAGERLLVVSGREDQLGVISRELWGRVADSFLAHGFSGGDHDARQPILLSGEMAAGNGAKYLAIADGVWRDSDTGFERTFYIFDDETLQPARECWVMLGKRGGIDRRFWKQQGGKWVEGP
ncbi:DNA polymerase III subunit chi [Novosphingobium sp. PS1R-30]|uniref:DNA polymerase III subunit chi n=1 Tax=Novosphingobium anseongense TaxID=3133436 RepID=A0ABU8RU16_9SPHN|nr:MAG: DNA polymerase III subunit chi [Novosphingobium sp.]